MKSVAELRHKVPKFALLFLTLSAISAALRPSDAALQGAPRTLISAAIPSDVGEYQDGSEEGEIPSYVPRQLRKAIDAHDSWRPMLLALSHMRESGTDALYEVFFGRQVKFQYPPSSLLILESLEALFGESGLSFPLLNAISALFFLATLVCVSRVYTLVLSRTPEPTPALRLADHLAPVLFAALAYPMVKSLAMGQVQTWLNALFSGAVLLFLLNRKTGSGVLLGAICAVKPQLSLFLIWGMLRREYRFVRGMVMVLAGCGLVSLLRYGWTAHAEYLRVLSFLSRHGESYYLNQSLNGLLLRMLGIGPNIQNGPGGWIGGSSFPPFHPGVYAATTISSLLLIAWACIPRRPVGDPSTSAARDLCFAGVCFTLASPIAWVHHYGIIPVTYAVAVPLLLRSRVRWAAVSLATCWLLIAVALPWTKNYADSWLNILQSTGFFGAIGLLVTLEAMRRSEPPPTTHPTDPAPIPPQPRSPTESCQAQPS